MTIQILANDQNLLNYNSYYVVVLSLFLSPQEKNRETKREMTVQKDTDCDSLKLYLLLIMTSLCIVMKDEVTTLRLLS